MPLPHRRCTQPLAAIQTHPPAQIAPPKAAPSCQNALCADNEDKVNSPFFSGTDAFLGYWTWPSECHSLQLLLNSPWLPAAGGCVSPAASTIALMQPARTSCFPPTHPAAVRNSYMAAFLPITPASTEQEKHQVCMLSVYCWCLPGSAYRLGSPLPVG